MVYINEWLPNPSGSDAAGEWLELYNSGPSTVDLSGWSLTNAAGKHSFLGGTMEAGQYLLLRRPSLKFSLKNRDEMLSLHDASGRVVDQAGFQVTAPEGKSFGRSVTGSFVFGQPTPGAANMLLHQTASVGSAYTFGVPLTSGISTLEMAGAGVIMSLVLSFAILFAIKRDHDLSELFFRIH